VHRDPLNFQHPPTPGLISVVLPSRRRPEMLAAAVGSLCGTAAHPDLMEVLVAYDPDDQPTGQQARALGAAAWEAPQRYGWHGNHLYFGHLFGMVAGEWLLPWGDDGRMLTEGWDRIVRDAPPGVLHHRGGAYGCNTFPIVHRSVLDAIGRYVPSPHQDTWLTNVAAQANCLHHVGIEVLEDRPDLTGSAPDATWQEGSIHQYRTAEYNTPEMAAERAADARRIAAALRDTDASSTTRAW
jgi:hypothetical protein